MNNFEVRKAIFKEDFIKSMKSDFVDTKFLKDMLNILFVNKIDLKELSEILNQPIDDKENTALHIVAAKGDEELTKLFVQYGAQIDIKNNLGKTPLEVARAENATMIGKALNALTFGYTDYRDTTKTQAMIKDTAEVVTKFQSMARGTQVKKAKQAKKDLESVRAVKIIFKHLIEKDPSNYNLIKGTIRVIDERFGKGALKGVLDQPIDAKGNTVLHIAAIDGDIDLARILVRNGASLEPKNKKGNTPEIEAINNQRSVFDELSDAPDTDKVREYLANTKVKDVEFQRNETLAKGLVEEIKQFYTHHAKKSSPESDIFTESALLKLQEISKTEDFQKNPLEYLGSKNLVILEEVLHGQKDKTSSLYQSGASGWVNYYDHDGYIQTAIDTAREILQVGQDFQEQIDRTIVFENFRKALESSDMSKIDKVLQKMSPEVRQDVLSQAMDKEGNTALHLAALKGDKKLAEVLVTNGANVTAENKDGDTPEKVAVKNQRSFLGRLANYPDTEPVRDYLSDADKIKKSKLGKEIRELSSKSTARARLNKVISGKPVKVRQ